MRSVIRSTVVLIVFLSMGLVARAQGTWVQQPTALAAAPTTFVQVGGLWGIAMTDTGTGFAAGYASVSNGFSGVLRKLPGNPTWFVLPSSNFAGLATSHSLWSAVAAVGSHAWVCGSNGRLYKTTDNGNTWSSAAGGLGGNTLFDIHFQNQNEGMTVGSDGVFYYTSDGGTTWIAQTLPATVQNTTDLYAVYSRGGNWYVTGATHTLMRGTPATSSTSWVDLTANLPGIGGIEGLQFLDDNLGTLGGVSASGSPIYRTTNAGASWTAIGNGLPGSNPYNGVAFFHPDSGWVGNAPDNIQRTADGGQNWTATSMTPLPGQTPANQLTRLSFPARTIGYAAGGAPGTTSTGWILRWQTPPVPDIGGTPDSLDFGILDCDTTTTKVFTISNRGSAVLNISSITFSSSEFTMAGPTPTTVPIGGGATFSIRWTPATPGPMPANAGMTIVSDDPDDNPWFVQFTGAWNVGTLAIGDNYDFGTTCIGDSVEVNLMVTVSGNLSPTIIAFEHVSGPAFVRMVTPLVGQTVSGTVPFTFRAHPLTGGTLTAVYRLIHGNPLCPKQQLITFTATVRNADLTLSQPVVDFGEVCVGEHKDLEITVTNGGTTPGVISQRIFAGGRDVFPNQHFTPFGPVSPGGAMQYRLRFAPTTNDTGLIQAEYKLVVDPCRDTLFLTLKGRGVKPAITFTPTSVLGLGPVPTGQVTEENVFITNTGNATLSIAEIRLAPPHPRLALINMPALPLTLPVGQSTSVRVRFSPDRIETINANLCVRWTSPCPDSACLPVAASSGDAPTIAVDTVLDMGTQPCAGELRDTIWVRNTGGGTLTLHSLMLTGNHPHHFLVRAPATPRQVPPNDSVAVIIGFLRADNGASTAELVIAHNDGKVGNASVVTLRALRQSVEFGIEGDSTSAFVSCVNVGASRSFQIRNRGIQELEVRDITVVTGAAQFHVASTPLPALVPGGSGLSFEINFTPTAKGTVHGTVRVTVGPCDDTYLISVTGEGNITEVSFSPDPVEFGSVDVGDSDTRTVRITNNGTTALSVQDLFLRPAAGEFSIESAPNLPVIINAGGARDVTIRFTPQSVGARATNLCVAVTAPCPDTVCVTVRGRGNSTGLDVTKTRMEFTLDPCTMDARCDTIEIVNSSGTAVTLTAVRVEPPDGFTVTFPATLPHALANGSTLAVRVCAEADFTGTRAGNLVIESNDANVPLIRVPLTARRDSSGIDVSAQTIDFGAIASCEVGVSQLVTITNTGAISEFVDTLRRGPAFVVTTIIPVALQPGQVTQARITFAPPAPGVFEDTLYFTTARCGTRVPLVLRGAMHATNYEVQPVPLNFSNVPVGSNQILNYTFTNLHLPSVRIADVRISPPGMFASWGAYPKTVTAGSAVQLPIQYTPTDAGPHGATACIIIDLPCPDTICVAMQGSTGDGALDVRPAALAFGIVPQCADVVRSDTVRHIGSGRVTLTAARMEGNDASYFMLDDPILAAEHLDPGAARVFTIRARGTVPPGDGEYDAALVVDTDNSAQPELRIPLSMSRRTLAAPADVIVDFGTMFSGTAATRRVPLRNTGSMPATIDDVLLPAGVRITPPLPITIPAGGEISIDIDVTPTVPGAYAESVALRVTAPCALETQLTLRGAVEETFNVTALTFGEVPLCRATEHTATVVRNATTTNAAITAARLEGADAAAFTLIAPAPLPVVLPGGGTLSATLRVLPDPAQAERVYAAELVLTTELDGRSQEIRIPVSADARTSQLSLLAPIDFGPVSLGTISAPVTARFRNTRDFPITIDSLRLTGAVNARFRITASTPMPPVVIGPGETLDVALTCEPLAAAAATAELQLFSSDPCTVVAIHPVRGEGIDDALRATLRIGAHSGSVDAIIDIPLLLEQDLGGADVRSWEGDISFDGSMLYPLSVSTVDTRSADMQLTMAYDQAAGTVHLTATGGTLRAGSGPLAFLRVQVLVGAAASTPLRIDPGFAFTSGRARVETRIDGSFTLTAYCAADGTRFVRAADGVQLLPNHPNPFRDATVLEYTTVQDGEVSLIVHDRMGREVARVVNGQQPAGRYRLTLDGTALPPGLYFAVLRSGEAQSVRTLLRIE